MLEGGQYELDALQRALDRNLIQAGFKTQDRLHVSLKQTEAIAAAMLNLTATKLDTVLAPSRDNVRSDLARSIEEQSRRREAMRRRKASGRGFATHFARRPPTAQAASGPKHPVVLVSEAAALSLSVMLLVAAGDFASHRHLLTSPPHIASVSLKHPRRNAEYDTSSSLASVTEEWSAMEQWSAVAEEWSAVATYAAPTTVRAEPEGAEATLVATYWSAMRALCFAWLVSLSIILVRAGTDEWAARAIGIEPCAPTDAVDGAAPRSVSAGHLRYEYDWERDVWREV